METRQRGQGAGWERAMAGMETQRRAVAPVLTEEAKEAEGVGLGNGGHGRSVALLFTYGGITNNGQQPYRSAPTKKSITERWDPRQRYSTDRWDRHPTVKCLLVGPAR